MSTKKQGGSGDDLPRWWSVRQVAERTGLSVDTVRRWIRLRRLRAYRPKGYSRSMLFVRPDDVRKLIEGDARARAEEQD